MKIFEFHSEGEIDTVVADDMFEAIKWYLDDSGINFSDLDNVIEIPKEDWTKHKVCYPGKEDQTYGQAVESAEEMPPYILASTVYL